MVPTNQSRPKDDQGRALDGAKPHVINLLDSLGRSTYPADRIRVLIGDDTADDAIYRGRSDRFAVTRLLTTRAPGERFNYATKMNTLWRAAETDCRHPDERRPRRSPARLDRGALTFARGLADRAASGAACCFPIGRIQHAGMTGGIFDVFAHPWYNRDAAEPTYGDWALTRGTARR